MREGWARSRDLRTSAYALEAQGIGARRLEKKRGSVDPTSDVVVGPGAAQPPARSSHSRFQAFRIGLLDRSLTLHRVLWELLDTPRPSRPGKTPRILAVKRRGGGHPPTNGRPGGKLPLGKGAARSPARSFSASSRKAATNQA